MPDWGEDEYEIDKKDGWIDRWEIVMEDKRLCRVLD
jgi:hypothetical protein